jgi:AsmA protein
MKNRGSRGVRLEARATKAIAKLRLFFNRTVRWLFKQTFTVGLRASATIQFSVGFSKWSITSALVGCDHFDRGNVESGRLAAKLEYPKQDQRCYLWLHRQVHEENSCGPAIKFQQIWENVTALGGSPMRILKWVGIILGLLIVAVVSLPFLINVDQFRPTLQADLTSALGRQVTLGNLRLKILSGEVTADDLSVAEDPAFGKPAFLQAKSLHVGVEIFPFLFSRKLIVTDMLLDQPEIVLVQSNTGSWNFSGLGGKSQAVPAQPVPSQPAGGRLPLDLSVKLIKISNGKLTLRRTVGHWKPLALEQANLELRDFSSSTAFPFTLTAQVVGGGTVKLDGTAGPLNPTDSAMTPVTVTLNVSQLDLARSGMNDFAPDVSGMMTFSGKGESDGVSMGLQGKLKLEKLKLAKNGSPSTRPVEMDFAVQHDLRKHAGVVKQGDIHIGSAVAHVTGNYAEQGESMILHVKLAGPGMPVQELEALLPAMGIVLPLGTSLRGGTASAHLSMEGPADRLVTTGKLSMNDTKLVGFDLPKKMASIEKLAGIRAAPDTEIQVLSANVRSAPEGTSAQDMKLVVPAIGELSGAGTVSPANALDFKMIAIVHTSGMLAVVGNTPIPFSVQGTSADPIFRPDVKAIVKEELKGAVGKAAGGLLNGLLGGKKKN